MYLSSLSTINNHYLKLKKRNLAKKQIEFDKVDQDQVMNPQIPELSEISQSNTRADEADEGKRS